jgi:hypothetical protein
MNTDTKSKDPVGQTQEKAALKCSRCQTIFEDPRDDLFEAFGGVCNACNPLYPRSLLKATCDEFDYALRLSSGEIIRFRSAEIHGDYVRLSDVEKGDEQPLPFIFDRGIDVRLSAIIWCADAPNGS